MNKDMKYITALMIEFISVNVAGYVNTYGRYSVKSTSFAWFVSLLAIFIITMIAWGFSSPGGPKKS